MAARDKRSLDPSNSQEGLPDRKRPALARVIVEALKVDSLQKLCSSLEPILRRVVSEEVERALAKLGPAKLNGRISPRRIEGPDGRNLQLQFRSKLSLPLFTGGKVEGEQGAAIHIVLHDVNTGQVVTSGPESSLKLDVVVLEGDFSNEDNDGWSQEEFESHVVREREGKRPLLTGDLQVALKDGVGTLGELSFTDNSSWIRSRKFRLGLRVSSSNSGGFRIREAKTEAFMVKDHRGELYKKHYPPALDDEVWRLEKIGKDGSFHKRLNEAGIFTVEDFLRLVVRDQQKLRNILGSGMSNKMWDVLVDHSKTCVLSGNVYVYYPDEPRDVGVVFNNIYELSGLIAGGQYYSVDSLSESQKGSVDMLVKKAYDNWAQVVEYDGKSLQGFDQTSTGTSQTQDQLDSFDPPNFPNSVHPPMNQVFTIEGYNNNVGGGFSMQQQNTNLKVVIGTSTPYSMPQSENLLGLGPPMATTIPEDEIRARSHELLESEDMQQLLRMFSMGGHGYSPFSYDVNENNHVYSAYGSTPLMPSGFGFDVEHMGVSPSPSPSGKAVVGWLKLKAAVRWGIFIRKQAAERRAQIEELDD